MFLTIMELLSYDINISKRKQDKYLNKTNVDNKKLVQVIFCLLTDFSEQLNLHFCNPCNRNHVPKIFYQFNNFFVSMFNISRDMDD